MHAYNANQGSYDYSNNELDGELDAQSLRSKPEPLESLVKLTKFDKRELKLFYRGFKQICPLGVVREDKFKLIYAQFFPRCADTNSYAKFVFNSFDIQRKQEITFTDFVIRLSVLTRGTIEEKIKWIFTLYDINGDGVITREEFSKIVGSIYDLVGKNQRSLGATKDASTRRRSSDSSTIAIPNNQNDDIQLEMENLFKKFDLNNDGIITSDEFLEACRRDSNIIKSISVFNTIL